VKWSKADWRAWTTPVEGGKDCRAAGEAESRAKRPVPETGSGAGAAAVPEMTMPRSMRVDQGTSVPSASCRAEEDEGDWRGPSLENTLRQDSEDGDLEEPDDDGHDEGPYHDGSETAVVERASPAPGTDSSSII